MTSERKPPAAGVAKKEAEPKPAPSFLEKCPAADVLRRCFGYGNEQAKNLVKTLPKEAQAELAELAKKPDYGPAVRRILDAFADRQIEEAAAAKKAEEETEEGATDTHG